jgi:hypothetical protein
MSKDTLASFKVCDPLETSSFEKLASELAREAQDPRKASGLRERATKWHMLLCSLLIEKPCRPMIKFGHFSAGENISFTTRAVDWISLNRIGQSIHTVVVGVQSNQIPMDRSTQKAYAQTIFHWLMHGSDENNGGIRDYFAACEEKVRVPNSQGPREKFNFWLHIRSGARIPSLSTICAWTIKGQTEHQHQSAEWFYSTHVACIANKYCRITWKEDEEMI